MKKIFWGCLVLVLALVTYQLGALDFFADEDRLRRLLLESGPWGPIIFALSFAVVQGLGAPGIPLVILSAILWPYWVAVAASYFGSLGAAVVGFGFARYGARDWLQARLPARFHRYDSRLAHHGFHAVLVIRLAFFLAAWTNWVLGLSRVQFIPFAAGTVFGFVPWTLFWVYAGRRGYEWLQLGDLRTWLAIAVVGMVIAATLWLRSRRDVVAEEILETVPD